MMGGFMIGKRDFLAFVMWVALVQAPAMGTYAQPPVSDIGREAQKRVVKIYGAGGLSGLESYQSGILVSPEGHIATAWSYVLDVDPVVQLDDGSRFEGKLVDFESTLELAVIKIEAGNLPFFELPALDSDESDGENAEVRYGDFVIAVSNLFNIATGNEPASVMQGSIAAVAPLDARRGTYQTPYRGEVYVLDLIANNPGAAGGALVDARGRLIGMLGKELRDSSTGVWLNYALPAARLRGVIGDIIAGRVRQTVPETSPVLPRDQSHSLSDLGLLLVPDVLESTPAYIDKVVTGSPAALAGLRPDDLLLLLGGERIESQSDLKDDLQRIDRRDDVELTVRRGGDILTVRIRP